MSVEMNKLMPPALERPIDGAEQEMGPREQAVSTTQVCGEDGATVDTSCLSKLLPDVKIRELEEIFTALEEDLRNLESRLVQEREEHEMRLKALEREMIQERLEWEREMREKEEALLSALMTVTIGRGKLLSDLRSHMEKQSLALLLRPAVVPAVKAEQPKKAASPATALQNTSQLEGADRKLNPPVVIQERQSRTWWCFKKHQATAAVAVQDGSSSNASKDADLQKITKLEERVRKAELKKQQKAAKKAAKAEKKAKKVEEKRAKKEAKKAEKEAKKLKENSLQERLV